MRTEVLRNVVAIVLAAVGPSLAFTARRHVGHPPPTDWEPGLREATHQALRREAYTDPGLRDRLLEAPIVGRQDTYLPFGDITVLARGQLYATAYGYRYVQDPYQNDCDECHNRPIRCGPVQCDGVTPWGVDERLLALWTVKRIRHQDQRSGGHRYEVEYTISPVDGAAGGYPIVGGRFDYNIPGHVFIVRSAPTGQHAAQAAGYKLKQFYEGDYRVNSYQQPLEPAKYDAPPLDGRKQHAGDGVEIYKALIESLDTRTIASRPAYAHGFTSTKSTPAFAPQVPPVLYTFEVKQTPATIPYVPRTTPTIDEEFLTLFTAPPAPMVTPNRPATEPLPTSPTFLSKKRPTTPTYDTDRPLPLQKTPITTITYFMPIDELPPETTSAPTTAAPRPTFRAKHAKKTTRSRKKATTPKATTATPFISKQEAGAARSRGVFLSNRSGPQASTATATPLVPLTTATTTTTASGASSSVTTQTGGDSVSSMSSPRGTLASSSGGVSTPGTTPAMTSRGDAETTTAGLLSVALSNVPDTPTTASTETEATDTETAPGATQTQEVLLITPRNNATTATTTTDAREETTKPMAAFERIQDTAATTSLDPQTEAPTSKTPTRPDDVDIFAVGKDAPKTDASPLNRTESYKNEGDFLFELFERANKTEDKPTIIFSNFYTPTPAESTTAETATTEAPTAPTLPETSQSYRTSISYKVNRKRSTTRAPPPRFRHRPRVPAVAKSGSGELDLLAQSLVNHARTIKILNGTARAAPKGRRRTRVRYVRKRKL